jgi:hypothetical protein
MAWLYDAPSGVFKDHALSRNIRREAARRLFYAKLVRPEPNYGRGRGQSITITRVLQLANRAGRINEIESIPVVTPSISTKSLTVALWGVQMELTEFQEHLTHFNIRNVYQSLLRDNIEFTTDGMVIEAANLSPICLIPTAASGGGSFDSDGTPSTVADVNVSAATVKKARDNFVRRKKRPFPNGRFIAAFSVTAARGLRDDAEAKAWFQNTAAGGNLYTTGGIGGTEARLPTGMSPMAEYMGRIENVDCYEVNHPAGDALMPDLAGTSTVCGTGHVFAEDALFLAEVMKPELRAEQTRQLGTKRALGWVGEMEAGLVWDDADQSGVIRITSA